MEDTRRDTAANSIYVIVVHETSFAKTLSARVKGRHHVLVLSIKVNVDAAYSSTTDQATTGIIIARGTGGEFFLAAAQR